MNTKDNFDVLNSLFDIFVNDSELVGLLCDTTGLEGEALWTMLDNNIRKSVADAALIVPEELPFFDFSFCDGYDDSENYLLCRSPIEFNIYAQNYYVASQVYKAIHRVLKENLEDAQVNRGKQRLTPLPGMYCHSFRIKQFVSS